MHHNCYIRSLAVFSKTLGVNGGPAKELPQQ